MFKVKKTLLVISMIAGSFSPIFAQPINTVNSTPTLLDKNSDATISQTSSKKDRNEHPFDRDWLIAYAKKMAEKEFEAVEIEERNPLTTLSYDQYRAIEFQNAASIWSKEDRNFRLGLLHPGFLYKTPVEVNLITAGVSRKVLYTNDIFNYGNDSDIVEDVAAPGYSGVRINTPINKKNKWDEFLVFQGGSYFRALGKNNWYGLSSRGLAINTAKAIGEEFPAFTNFWIERPRSSQKHIVVHALLNSQSITGAFTFKATPGEHTRIEVEAALFPREDLTSFGFAPLTSMFLLDGTNRRRVDDFRPAVHDSDGLLILQSNNERIWRPLANPIKLQVSSFIDTNVKGFGLVQRKRTFDDFEDIEAHYHHRPSVWIEPKGEWGEGHVELVEIPTDREFNDNIVAFWQPKKPLKKGIQKTFHYTMVWSEKPPIEVSAGRVLKSHSGLAIGEDRIREFVIDYDAKSIPENILVRAQTSAGRIIDARGKSISENGKYRVFFKFDPDGTDLAEFRVWLTNNDNAWGETWLYRWTR